MADDEYNGPEDSAEHDSLWDNDSALEALKMEREVNPDLSNEALAKKMLDEAVPNIMQGLINLAMHATSDGVRLNAQKTALQIAFDDQTGSKKPAWEDFVASAVSEAELHANTSTSQDN